MTDKQSQNIEFWLEGVKLNPFTHFGKYPSLQLKVPLHLKLKNIDILNKVVAPKTMIPKIGNELNTIPSLVELSRKTEL